MRVTRTHKFGRDNYQKCIPVICLIILNTNVSFFQITVDITAPQPGFVHDGIYGSPEIDYQNDMHLNLYWDGFFDPESAVKYYKYLFSDRCWNRQELFDSNEVNYFIIRYTLNILLQLNIGTCN